MPACCSAVRAEISIHALRKEGDDRAVVRDHECRGFLSTPSARRATQKGHTERRRQAISIHALREEGDHRDHHGRLGQQDFYPRPPRGGRLGRQQLHFDLLPISIHALREEGDKLSQSGWTIHWRFLSTPSAKRATIPATTGPTSSSHFYPRPPRGGRPMYADDGLYFCGFLSTPSARRATADGQPRPSP